jgi:transcriptional regulator with XRE-family HTH domain
MREVTRLRQQAGLSMDRAAQRLDWSKSKLYRIEAGRTRITTDDLEDVLDLYGVRSPDREALIQLGRDARKRGWWTTYSDVFTGSYIALEAEAASIKINANVIPGIFQTAGYAREMIARTRPTITPDESERTVAARTARQQALATRENPADIHVVLDEAAIRRQVGGPEITRLQLESLAAAGAQPHVTLQVLPFSSGAHAGLDGRFTILAFPDPEDPPVAYVEGLMGDVYLESEMELDVYNLAWAHLVGQAMSPADSAAMIGRLAKETL